ncbi:MAG: NAD(P)/FAD-dependent oxidoreductase [Paludibacteraceae bacterium]|nr:NAD(P)/FAD-dependent oxidoreductase [Paludibacteraceae bacterium]
MGKNVVIMGGGIGGLVSACLLCKEGFTPTVIEQHYKIGGGLHCFDRYGATFEAGIHYVSGFEENGNLRKIFSYIGIMDKLELMPMDKNGFDIIHVGTDNLQVKFGVGKNNFIRLLSEQFPHQADNIQKYMDALYEICDKIQLFNLKPVSKSFHVDESTFIPVEQFIEQFISDKKLQLLLTWNNSLYSGTKNQTPIYIHALITRFYVEGATRFVGGSQQVADEMVKVIEAHGGKIILNTEIVKIEVEDKKIQKIIAADGREFTGDYYISDIHPALLMELIDPTQIQKAYRDRLINLENSYSAFIVYIKFKPQSFPFINNNYFYYKNYELLWEAINYEAKDYPPGFWFSTPPSKNQGEYADKAMISCMIRYSDFKQWENTGIGKRGNEYETFKKEIETKLVDLVNEIFPTLKDSIEHIFSATPLTIRDYLKTKEGGLYGYKKNTDNIVKAQILPRTKIENLFLTGQNINLHGIIGVPLSAIVTVGELTEGIDYLLEKININHN